MAGWAGCRVGKGSRSKSKLGPHKASITHNHLVYGALQSGQLWLGSLWHSDLACESSPSVSVFPGGLRSSTDGPQPSAVRV